MLGHLQAPLLVLVLVVAAAGCSDANPASGAPSSSQASSAASASSGIGATSAVTITGVEYRYEGVPATATVGTTFAFKNGGAEVHEMTLVRRNDNVTTSLDDLLKLPLEQALKQVTIVGSTVANPGEAAAGSLTLAQRGAYVLVCFIPQGTKSIPSLDPNATIVPGAIPSGLGTGPPHFTLGMHATFEVP